VQCLYASAWLVHAHDPIRWIAKNELETGSIRDLHVDTKYGTRFAVAPESVPPAKQIGLVETTRERFHSIHFACCVPCQRLNRFHAGVRAMEKMLRSEIAPHENASSVKCINLRSW
jgi:hypothetical protein